MPNIKTPNNDHQLISGVSTSLGQNFIQKADLGNKQGVTCKFVPNQLVTSSPGLCPCVATCGPAAPRSSYHRCRSCHEPEELQSLVLVWHTNIVTNVTLILSRMSHLYCHKSHINLVTNITLILSQKSQ